MDGCAKRNIILTIFPFTSLVPSIVVWTLRRQQKPILAVYWPHCVWAHCFKLTHLTKQNKVHRRLSLKFAREWSDIPSQDRFAQCCLSSPFPRCRKFWNSGTSQEEVFVALVRSREFCLGMFCRPGLCLRRVGGSCYHPQPVLLDHSLICSDKKVPGIFFSCHVHGMGRNLNSSSYPVKFKTSNEVYTVKRKTP